MWGYYWGLMRRVPRMLFEGTDRFGTLATIIYTIAALLGPQFLQRLTDVWNRLPVWYGVTALGVLVIYELLKANWSEVDEGHRWVATLTAERDEARAQAVALPGTVSYIPIDERLFQDRIVPEAKADSYELKRPREEKVPRLEQDGWELYPIASGSRRGYAAFFDRPNTLGNVVMRRPRPYRALSRDARRILRAAKETDPNISPRYAYTVWYKEGSGLSAGRGETRVDSPDDVKVLDELLREDLLTPSTAASSRPGGSQVYRLSGTGHTAAEAIIADLPDSIPEL